MRRQIVRFLETLQTGYTVLPILELEIIKVLFFTFSIELHGIYFLIQYLSFKNFAECTFFVVVVFCTFAVCGVLLFFHNSCPEYGWNRLWMKFVWMLHVASVCTPCCMLLDVVAQSLKPVKVFSQQLPTFLLFRDRWSVAQQCWIRLHSSSNIVGATHAHYAWFTKTGGLYPSDDALQVPTLLGVAASVCTPLPTCTQQLPTLLAQQCWELLRQFARSLTALYSRCKSELI